MEFQVRPVRELSGKQHFICVCAGDGKGDSDDTSRDMAGDIDAEVCAKVGDRKKNSGQGENGC